MEDNKELRARLQEAEDTLDAIRTGSVDALVVAGPGGDQIYTLSGADHNYRLLIEEMSEGAVVLTPVGDILYCNRRFAELLRLPLERVIGSPLHDVFAQEDHTAVKEFLAKSLREGTKHEFTIYLAAGKTVPIYLSACGLEIEGVQTICLIVTDLTEQKRHEETVAAGKKRLEEELLKANKLESIGILAGGLAHDLNNSLTAVLGNISLAKRSSRPGEDVHRRLTEAETACLQARDVTQQLLTFARGGVPVRKPTAISQLLKEWAGFALSGSNVQCEFKIDEKLWPVEIDEGQIGRVINNLIINAQQAMPEGGRVTIRATNDTVGPNALAKGLPLEEGQYVRIEVRDTGMGIPEPYLPKIFDPYFTTKQKGSGLGLSIAYSVVKSHNGYIAVDSKLGEGTAFVVYLPASTTAPQAEEQKNGAERVGRLKVLVMDDQEAIRELIKNLLVDLEGHDVEFANDGAKAVGLYRHAFERGRPFDVVLLDLTVPGGMGGKEAAKRLLEIDPNARVIVVSGYSNDPIMSEFRDYGFSGFIRKPFEIDHLLDTLNSVASGAPLP
jgi:PAS domain S-box-containing protein